MSIIHLTQNSVFSPGSNIWFLSPYESCTWTSEIDWYLNFQITRSMRLMNQKQKPSEFLNWVWEKTEISIPLFKMSEDAPMMILAKDHLPTDWIIVIPWNPKDSNSSSTDLRSWLEKWEKVWQQMKQPSCRIFLPKNVDPQTVEPYLQNLATKDISLVPNL